MQHKVLIVVGDATETLDTLYPVLRVQEEGFEAVVAGPEKRKYNMVMHERTPGWDITREWEGYKIESNIAFRDIEPSEYVGIFFSGGRAPEYIREDPDLIRVTQYFFEKNKPIASVCHGVGNSGACRLCPGPSHGLCAQMQVRSGSLRRYICRREGLRRRQSRQRHVLGLLPSLHEGLDRPSGKERAAMQQRNAA
jgi:putative intracellular protease/amidase